MQMKKYRMFVDAETDGLYGRFLSVASLVTDEENRETDHFYGMIQIRKEDITSPWVKENVLPYLSNAEECFDNEQELLEAFWAFWMKYRDSAECIADVPSPVEARLFARCVAMDPVQREFLAPFPLFDLSTLIAARGLPWNADRAELSGLGLIPHDAMNDVRMAAAIWHRLFPVPM